jgi:CBS-domain-containing membrane protein
MSTDIQTCQPSHTLREAEQLMSRVQVRRLPVVDDAGQLLGLVSLADIAAGSVGMRAISKKAIPKRDVADTLVAVSRSRGVTEPEQEPEPTPVRAKNAKNTKKK